MNDEDALKLSRHDPFAPREGRELLWKNMTIELVQDDKKKILDHVWGQVPPRQITAILGPSGSGKSSLLNVLSGRTSSNKSLKVTSEIRINNVVVDPTNIKIRQQIAFVAQDDSIQVTATPREAILFSAKLRLPKGPDEDMDKLVNRMLDELGLTDCADTIVGNALIKGISGGERKRTSVALELVTQPKLVFLDEPTSGLDSYSAVQLVNVLNKVAVAGCSVLCTIHQPSSEIFAKFDHLILLKNGRIMCQASIERVESRFADCGYPLPAKYNPADWIMQIAQTCEMDELETAGFFPNDTRVIEETGSDKSGGADGNGSEPTDGVGFTSQVKLLFAREVANFVRNKHALGARTAMTTAISVVISCIFFGVAEEDTTEFINVQSTFGALLMALLANVFSTALPSLIVFPQERPVFLREYSTDHYSVVAYFSSRLAMEFLVTAVQVTLSSLITYFCIGFSGNFGTFYGVLYLLAMTSTALGVLVGSSAEDPSVAVEFLPAVFMPQIIFAGFFIPPHLIPDWLAWLRFVFPLTYAVRIALVNEFDGSCDNYLVNNNPINNCDVVLDNVGADPDEVWWNWLVLGILFVVFRLLALFNLRRKAAKFY